MRSVERHNHVLRGISSESNKERERKVERGREDPQLKFPNGVERNVPRKYYDFFIAHRRFIFSA